jgi:glycosyltransferase involved in cell wall biosynthesis
MSHPGPEPQSSAGAAPIRVCLDARLVSGEFGGVEQVIIGLADGLSRLVDSPDEYMFLVDPGHDEWLRPYLGGPCRLLVSDRLGAAGRGADGFVGRQGRRVVRRLRRIAGRPAAGRQALAVADGAVERAGPDVMHFTMQIGFRTTIPSIYQPWDLQHLHLPEFFTPEIIANRELTYRALCDQAETVVVMSRWIKHDFVEKYALPEDKVQVVPLAPVIDAYRKPSPGDLAETRARFGLPETFALYPAKAWSHKNHLRLLKALKLLREEHGLAVPVVCTGAQNGLEVPVREAAAALGVADQVIFTGYLGTVELRSIYGLARLLVFPSLFEGFGMPILEAFAAELPVACSNVTSLPDLAGSAARLFDPRDTSAIAAAVRELWTDESRRQELRRRGLTRAAAFSWDRTARIYRAHYRRLVGRALTDEDADLLRAEPPV